MNLSLPSRLIGTIAAIAIAATTFSAAPAYAERDERAARAIATILGLAVVGKIIHDNNKSRKEGKNKVIKPHRDNGYGRVQQHRDNGYGRVKPRPLPRRVDRSILPRQCFRIFQTRRGQVNMFGQRCLERNFRGVNRLPLQCAQRIRTDRGVRAGFDARCLRRSGYRVSQR